MKKASYRINRRLSKNHVTFVWWPGAVSKKLLQAAPLLAFMIVAIFWVHLVARQTGRRKSVDLWDRTRDNHSPRQHYPTGDAERPWSQWQINEIVSIVVRSRRPSHLWMSADCAEQTARAAAIVAGLRQSRSIQVSDQGLLRD